MSKLENRFIKWFGSIAASLIIIVIVGIIRLYASERVLNQQIKEQQKTNLQLNKRIDQTRIMHYQDLKLIRQSIKNIEASQTITQEDIKKILVKLPKN